MHLAVPVVLVGLALGSGPHSQTDTNGNPGGDTANVAPRAIAPEIIETRTVELTQTVTLHDVPAGAHRLRMWVPVPSDAAWQRVLDRKVVSAPGAPGEWKIVEQSEGRGEFVCVDVANPKAGDASVVVSCTLQREGVHFPLEGTSALRAEGPGSESRVTIQPENFADALDQKAPLMESDARVHAMADKVCGEEHDPGKQAMMLVQAVAAAADHYSKDPSKPKCGRGSAGDCLDHGGGCCSDMHSLFIALARARGVPARIQYGYRILDAKAGADYDPGYRCWVEYFVPGAGWVPTDIVAADNADEKLPLRWSSLSATRVWLWQGRSFELTPKADAGRIDTMLCGWAEIDGKPIDVLPSADGKTPSRLGRTVQFKVPETTRKAETPKLPE